MTETAIELKAKAKMLFASFCVFVSPVLKKYFWVYYCTIFVILTAYSYFFAIETELTVQYVYYMISVVVFSFSVGVLIKQCRQLKDRLLFFVMSSISVFWLVFSNIQALPALGIAMLAGMMLFFPIVSILSPVITVFGCVWNESFFCLYLTLTLLCAYRAMRKSNTKKRLIAVIAVNTILVFVTQIVRYHGIAPIGNNPISIQIAFVVAILIAMSTCICLFNRRRHAYITIILGASLLFWTIFAPNMIVPIAFSYTAFYYFFIDDFFLNGWHSFK